MGCGASTSKAAQPSAEPENTNQATKVSSAVAKKAGHRGEQNQEAGKPVGDELTDDLDDMVAEAVENTAVMRTAKVLFEDTDTDGTGTISQVRFGRSFCLSISHMCMSNVSMANSHHSFSFCGSARAQRPCRGSRLASRRS